LGQQIASKWNEHGIDLLGQGRYEEAVQDFNIALGLNSSYAAAWYNKGLALYGLGRYGEAIQAYNRSIDLRPGFAEAWNNKDNALSGFCRYTDAILAYDKAIELNPSYSVAWYNKGLALEALGRDAEAKAALARPASWDTTDKGCVIFRKEWIRSCISIKSMRHPAVSPFSSLEFKQLFMLTMNHDR
jgi:tetratricopeptide (TPR) repeat protein